MAILTRRNALHMIMTVVALLAAACEHSDLGTVSGGGPAPGPAPGPSLGTASSYGILAGSTVTCASAPGSIMADVGVWAGSTTTGFPPCTISGATHLADA